MRPPTRRAQRCWPACAQRSRPRGGRPADRVHRRARHRRARRAVVAVVRAQPARRALAHLPVAGADPAGSGGHRATCSRRAPSSAHHRPGRRRAHRRQPGRRRSPSWPTASCAGSSTAISPLRSSAPRRSAGSCRWDAAARRRPGCRIPERASRAHRARQPFRRDRDGVRCLRTVVENGQPRLKSGIVVSRRAAVTPGSNFRRYERPSAERRSAAWHSLSLA